MNATTGTPSRPARRPLTYQGRALLFLVPYLLGTLVLVVVPAAMTVFTAFTRYSGIAAPVWTGLENLRRITQTPLIRLSLYNTLVFVGLSVPLRLVGALLLALLLQGRRRATGLYRTIVYLPTIMPETGYALIWLWILNPVYGPLNVVLSALGLPAPAWLSEAMPARLAIVLMAAFQVGEGLVVTLAGMQNIPAELYEAAAVDGANRWQAFWHITLPLLAPWLLLLTLRDLLVSLQNTFTPSYMLAYGGPYYATTFLPLLIYELSFDFMDLGLASAVLVVAYLWILLLVFGVRNLVEGLRGNAPEA